MRKLGDRILKVYVVFFFAVLFGPIIMMVIYSFNSINSFGVFGGLSIKWYSTLVSNPDIQTAIYNSITVALAATSLAAAVAVLSAFAVSRFSFTGRPALSMAFMIPIIIPEIAESVTFLIFMIWTGLQVYAGWVTVVMAHVVWFPLVYVVVRARLSGFDRSVEDAARVLGADEVQTFLRITMPLLLPGIVAGSLLMFTWSWDSLIKTSFTKGPGFNTLPIYIWAKIGGRRMGATPELNALATLSILLSVLLAILYARSVAKR